MIASRRTQLRRSSLLMGAMLAVASLLLTACGGSAAGTSGKGVLIGVAFPSQAQERVGFETRILKEEAEKNGDKVIFNFAQENMATQTSQVESMLQRGIKVLVLMPVEAEAAAPLVRKAEGLGVKVITYDRRVVGAPVSYHIERNNYENGKLHVESALAAKPSGKYAIIRGDKATIAENDMSKAYDKLLLHNPKIRVVYDKNIVGWDSAAAQKAAEAALQKDPDIVAFVVMWDNGAQAVAQAIKSAGKKPGSVWVTGTDASKPSLTFIAQGWQGETVWTPVDEMARKAADLAHDLATGKKLPKPDAVVDGVKTDYVRLTSITKGNLCDFVNRVAPKGWVTEQEVFPSGRGNCG
ncbi:substrate-binding domain-containing protein [Streptomyces sp. NPDC001604]|uniref:substrate-binding domain-containing protein n=1 Tax=Streptomyces sp. NPDC001604 TaxID=3364593 RepID=UPI0036BCC608